MRLRLTLEADADIARILRETKKLFGKEQVRRYADIIDGGMAMIAEDASRAFYAKRDDVRPGLKSFHLEHVQKRRSSASHLIYFQESTAPDGEKEVVIVGVVHERMLPKRKLGMVLRKLDEGEPAETPGFGRR